MQKIFEQMFKQNIFCLFTKFWNFMDKHHTVSLVSLICLQEYELHTLVWSGTRVFAYYAHLRALSSNQQQRTVVSEMKFLTSIESCLLMRGILQSDAISTELGRIRTYREQTLGGKMLLECHHHRYRTWLIYYKQEDQKTMKVVKGFLKPEQPECLTSEMKKTSDRLHYRPLNVPAIYLL